MCRHPDEPSRRCNAGLLTSTPPATRGWVASNNPALQCTAARCACALGCAGRGGGIRTRGRSPYDRFQGGSDRPLRHPSSCAPGRAHRGTLPKPRGRGRGARGRGTRRRPRWRVVKSCGCRPRRDHRTTGSPPPSRRGCWAWCCAWSPWSSSRARSPSPCSTCTPSSCWCPVVLTVAVLVASWWAWQTRGWVARLTPEGYRVQWVRGVGVRLRPVEGRRGRRHDHRGRRPRRGAAPARRARPRRSPSRCSPPIARRSSATCRTTCSADTDSATCDLIRRRRVGPCNLSALDSWVAHGGVA